MSEFFTMERDFQCSENSLKIYNKYVTSALLSTILQFLKDHRFDENFPSVI
jgi:hypothetical protein